MIKSTSRVVTAKLEICLHSPPVIRIQCRGRAHLSPPPQIRILSPSPWYSHHHQHRRVSCPAHGFTLPRTSLWGLIASYFSPDARVAININHQEQHLSWSNSRHVQWKCRLKRWKTFPPDLICSEAEVKYSSEVQVPQVSFHHYNPDIKVCTRVKQQCLWIRKDVKLMMKNESFECSSHRCCCARVHEIHNLQFSLS